MMLRPSKLKKPPPPHRSGVAAYGGVGDGGRYAGEVGVGNDAAALARAELSLMVEEVIVRVPLVMFVDNDLAAAFVAGCVAAYGGGGDRQGASFVGDAAAAVAEGDIPARDGHP